MRRSLPFKNNQNEKKTETDCTKSLASPNCKLLGRTAICSVCSLLLRAPGAGRSRFMPGPVGALNGFRKFSQKKDFTLNGFPKIYQKKDSTLNGSPQKISKKGFHRRLHTKCVSKKFSTKDFHKRLHTEWIPQKNLQKGLLQKNLSSNVPRYAQIA